MRPGNSFPQICVVSIVIISNVLKSHKSTKVLELLVILFEYFSVTTRHYNGDYAVAASTI